VSRFDPIRTHLESGDLVILPTETVFGLATRADNKAAVDKIYKAKGRAFNKPLALCVKDIEWAERYAIFDSVSRSIAAQHWPGSVTLVLNAKADTGLDTRLHSNDGEITIGLRCPNVFWREEMTLPLALTSANKSGEPDCTELDAAIANLSEYTDAALAADAVLSGAPSTVVRIKDGKLTVLRQGAVKVDL